MNTYKNVKDAAYGAAGNGSTNDLAAINAAIASTTDSKGIFFPAGTYKISGNLTIATGQSLIFDAGAKIQVDSGYTLTINGSVVGDLGQKFSGPGTTVFGFGSQVLDIPITWFGAIAGVSADQTPAILSAIKSANTGNGQRIRVPCGEYSLYTTLVLPSTQGRVKLVGEGFSKSTFVFTPATSGDACISITATLDRIEFEGLCLSAAAVAGKRSVGVLFAAGAHGYDTITEVKFKDVNIHNFNKYGVQVQCTGIYTRFEDCRFDGIQNTTANGGDGADYAYAIYNIDKVLAVCQIAGTRFSTCDGVWKGAAYLLELSSGSAIERCGCTTKADTGTRTTPGHIIDISGGFFTIDNVWTEINYADGSSWMINLKDTEVARISNNCFGLESGQDTKCYNMLRYESGCTGNYFTGNRINGLTGVTLVTVGSNCTNPKIMGSAFMDNTGNRKYLVSDILPYLTADKCDLFMRDEDDVSAITAFSYYGAGDGAIHQKLRVQARASSNPSAGYGASIGFWGSRINGASPTAPAEIANVTGRWDNATAGVEQGALRFNASVAGTMTDLAGVNSNGIIDSNGHIVKSKIVTTNTTLVKADGDCYLNANGLTVTIPDASTEPDRKRTFKLIAAGTGTLASNTIDGLTSYTLSAQNKYVTLHSVGSVWRIIAAG